MMLSDFHCVNLTNSVRNSHLKHICVTSTHLALCEGVALPGDEYRLDFLIEFA